MWGKLTGVKVVETVRCVEEGILRVPGHRIHEDLDAAHRDALGLHVKFHAIGVRCVRGRRELRVAAVAAIVHNESVPTGALVPGDKLIR